MKERKNAPKTKETDTTLCFRNFTSKHSELNRIYWTHLLAKENLEKSIATAPPEELTAEFLKSSFPAYMHPQKISETLNWLDSYMDRSRLHILIVCCANLESYLQEITTLYLLSINYNEKRKTKTHLELTTTEKALGAPILNKQSLPDPLKYSQELFQIDLSPELTTLKIAYNLRCAAAHNGGFIDKKTKQSLLNLNIKIGDQITLSWDDLKKYLKCIYDIAKKIDTRIQSYKMKLIETEKKLQEAKDSKSLPARAKIWEYLHENFSINGIKNVDKETIEQRLF